MTQAMMDAGWYEAVGPARDVLKVGRMPLPEPGMGEVRVRVACSGVNPSDVKARGGWRGPNMPYPRVIPHSDGAGVIDKVGAQVSPGRVGERVWVHGAAWRRPFGTCATHVVVPVQNAVLLPDGVGYEAGACMGIPAMTAHRCVFSDGPVRGKVVLVTGGAGMVGFYAIQLARWGGAAQVIATVSSPAKAQVALSAGAHHVLDYRTEPVAARVRELTAGQGVDRVVEVDLGANLGTLAEVLRHNAVIAAYASMAQPQVSMPFYALNWRNITLRHVLVYSLPPDALRDAAVAIGQWLRDPATRHLIHRRFALGDLAQAHEATEDPARIGQVIVDVQAL